MPIKCELWTVLGYSVKIGDGDGPYKEHVPKPREIFGPFKEIRFHVLRFGLETFELTIDYTGQPNRFSADTVAGMVGDLLVLKDGETVTFEKYSQDSHQLLLRFWKRD